MTPFVKNNIPLPCGKCPACRSRRASAWSFRLMQEEKISSSAYFLTLTYDTNNVHITEKGRMGLNKRDLQLFFKRLRKRHPAERKIRYYAVGEYGSKTERPHYHVILFNSSIEHIQPSWQLGQVHYGTVEAASVGYTLKYISKVSKFPKYVGDDRAKEFSIMSKGLGKSYVSDKTILWHLDDHINRMYLNIPDGKKIAMPRYYKERIYNEEQREQIAMCARLKAQEEFIIEFNSPDYQKKQRDKDQAIKSLIELQSQPIKSKL